jgi:(p)ppGpp synthase/HD superfamily hydrolase
MARVVSLAMSTHAGQTDRNGAPYFDHVRVVADSVAEPFERVAYLHDVVEDSDLSLSDVVNVLPFLSDWEVRALDLLTRTAGDTYAEYVDRIATAGGMAGVAARAVKEADLVHNLSRCLKAQDSMARRYRIALRKILERRLEDTRHMDAAAEASS